MKLKLSDLIKALETVKDFNNKNEDILIDVFIYSNSPTTNNRFTIDVGTSEGPRIELTLPEFKEG